MAIFDSSPLMAYPLAQRDYYPESHLIHVDMDPNDFTKSAPLYAAPAANYTSSPSLDSQADDDATFDVDLDYPHSNPHLAYVSNFNPQWDTAATPRAWIPEPHRPDSDSRKSSYSYPTAEGGVMNHQGPTTPSSTSVPLYNLDYDYLDESHHSPPTSYLSPPAAAAGSMGNYYSAQSPGSHVQQSPYSLPARYQSSLHANNPSCDPRFVSPAPHSGASSSPQQDVGISFADVYSDPSHGIKVEQDFATILQQCESDSGEEEKSDSDDPSYMMPSSSRSRPMSLPSSTRMRPRYVRSSSAGSSTTPTPRPVRIAAPEPVPNLTKKSRGRRVPTAAALYGYASPANDTAFGLGSGGKNTRTYVCKVKDCGKCFARSEHLKRHVRSIHTNEKPHRCPHPGCNKEFSRHDNLCQHMRVHRNFSAPKDGAFAPF